MNGWRENPVGDVRRLARRSGFGVLALALVVAASCNTCLYMLGGAYLPCASDDECPPRFYCDSCLDDSTCYRPVCMRPECEEDFDCGVGMACREHHCIWPEDDAGTDASAQTDAAIADRSTPDAAVTDGASQDHSAADAGAIEHGGGFDLIFRRDFGTIER